MAMPGAHQDQGTPGRHVYLLAIWQEQVGGHWRASLRSPGGEERQGFTTIEQLAAYLLRLTTPDPSDGEGGGARLARRACLKDSCPTTRRGRVDEP